MSSLSNMYVEEPLGHKSNDGIYVKKRKLYIILAIVAVVFVAALIFVYSSAKGSSDDETTAKQKLKCPPTAPTNPTVSYSTALMTTTPAFDLNKQCSAAICSNPMKALDWLMRCQGNSSANATSGRTEKIDYRLPTNLKPYLYDLTIQPYFNVTQSPQFYLGQETVYVKCIRSAAQFKIHMLENLVIDKPSFEIVDLNSTQAVPIRNLDSRYFIEKVYYDTRLQYLVVEFIRDVFVTGHHYKISFRFRGTLKDDNRGFYKSVYSDANGRRRWLMTSQMEPTHARKSFPCFDEPDLKARFKIRVKHDSSLHAFSNMPVEATSRSSSPTASGSSDDSSSLTSSSSEDSYDWVTTEFQETVDMSTYLVALIISDFECVQGIAHPPLSKRVEVNVCARPDAIDQLKYALDVAVKLTEFFEDYYKVEYPLAKLDHVAIPDFKSGAMENWGLITYREAVLLYDPKKTSQAAEQYIVEVIAHEIAHQWFGNLVSPKWWNDLWLNEGFARYMQFVGTHAVRPEWHMGDQIISNVLFPIMHLDSVASSHSISVDVNNPDQINEIFDGITYGKGGSVIRMMNYFLSESVFTNGLSEYLTKYQYAGARQENLWTSLQDRAIFECKIKGIDLTKAMNTWTKQMGHPLVHVRRINRSHIIVNQSHFLFDPSVKIQKSDYNYKWYIPFSYSIETLGSSLVASNFTARSYDKSNIHDNIVWMLPEERTKIIKLPRELGANDFVLANLDAFGFFRVNYDDSNWNLILKQLVQNRQSIPNRMRGQIVNDIFSLAQANKIRPTRPFELAEYMVNEDEHLPWSALIDRLSFYINLIESTEVYGELRNYLIELIRPIYSRLTWDNKPTDSWLTSQLRTEIIRFACHQGHDDCVKKARNLYSSWMTNPAENKIPKNYRSFVYCAAIHHGGWSEWQFASQQYDLEKDSVSRRALQYGMSCSKETWIQSRFLNDQLNKTKVRLQDCIYGLNYAVGHLYSSSMAWTFLKSNWNLLTERLGRDLAWLMRVYSFKITSTQQYNDFTEFIDKTPTARSMREYKMACERIEAAIKWKTRNFNAVRDWLSKRSQTKSQIAQEKIDYRLPTNLKPIEYNVMLTPYIGTPERYGNRSFTFDGQVSILYKCVEPTNRIVLHELDIVVHKIRLGAARQRSQEVPMSRVEHDAKREFLIINLDSPCVRNTQYTLSIEYMGHLNDILAGFYRSSYLDENKTVNYLAVTQFEATDARRAFPCFDEPAMKARFKISIVRHAKYFSTSMSNMPLEKIDPTTSSEWVIDRFAMSVPMSTYLVAFVVCNYKKVARNTTKHRILIEVAARPDAIEKGHGNYGLDEAAKIIDFFSDYFDNIYPLPKSTQVAIPDFNAGAMENWGLITYREKYILFDPASDSIFNKRWVTIVVAHELAHQWFGNLVSPLWWNDLWLNEGFASWVEYLGANHTHPEWKDLEYFFLHQTSAMIKDSLPTSHPISVEVNNPAEIGSLFDSISYEKGASIIRMMNSFLSLETFRKGITVYLKKYQMSNAKQDDLWEELDAQARRDGNLPDDLNLKTIMDTWTLQKGFPVVHVSRAANYFSRSITLRFTQNWFRSDKPFNQSETGGPQWYIPFTFALRSRPDFKFEQAPFWIKPNASESERTLQLSFVEDVSQNWVIGNVKHAGFYRVNYDAQNWQLLIEQLQTNKDLIDVVSRATLIDDSFNLAMAEYIDLTVYLSLISYLQNETDPMPFEAVFDGIDYISGMISQNYSSFANFKKLQKAIFKNSYQRLGWNESITEATTIYLQTRAINTMCLNGNEDCIAKSREYYNLWIKQDKPIPKNVKKIVLTTIVKFGTEEDWFYLLARAQNTTKNDDRILILRSLTATRDFNLLKMLLYKTWDRSLVKLQDQPTLIAVISSNPISRNLVWDFMMEFWDQVFANFGGMFTLDRLISSCFSGYNTDYELNKLESFVKANEDKMNSAVQNVFKEVMTTVRTNVRWMQRNFEAISRWLVNYAAINNK